MRVERDYYEILGVSRTDNASVIKRTFYKRAREVHPDVSDTPDAEEEFKLLSEAYNVLIDPEKRRNYDLYGDPNGIQTPGPTSDIFEDFISDIFGFKTQAHTYQEAKCDVHISVPLSAAQQILGDTFSVHYSAQSFCSACSGTGSASKDAPVPCKACGGCGREQKAVQTIFGKMLAEQTCHVCQGKGFVITDPCEVCHGEGSVLEEFQEEITLAAGIDFSRPYVVSEKGSVRPVSDKRGDLVVHFEFEIPEPFVATPRGLALPLKLSFLDLLCGQVVEIPTLVSSDEAKVTIEPMTPNHTVVTLENHGLAHTDGTRAPLYLELVADVPSDMSKDELAQIRSVWEKHRN